MIVRCSAYSGRNADPGAETRTLNLACPHCVAVEQDRNRITAWITRATIEIADYKYSRAGIANRVICNRCLDTVVRPCSPADPHASPSLVVLEKGVAVDQNTSQRRTTHRANLDCIR